MAERKRFTKGKLYENGESRRIVMHDDGETVTWMHPISLVQEQTPHGEFVKWFGKGGSSKPVKR